MKSFGHAGDGNLHIYTCSNDMEEEEFKKQVAVFMDKVYAKATEFGGMISENMESDMERWITWQNPLDQSR